MINFRTTYFNYNEDEIINGRLITKNYIQSASFYVDLVSTLPIAEISNIYFNSDAKGSYLVFLKQLKIFRILRLAKLQKLLSGDSAKAIF
jgi:hypothetical protein